MFRALLLTVGVGGLSVAAPVPKAPPPPDPKSNANLTLGTGSLNGQLIRITYGAPAVVAVGGPQPANPLVRPATRTLSVNLGTVKVTTADGTELTGDDLTKKLTDGAPVARSTVALDPEWKKLFADDVLFIEPSGKPAVGIGPAGPGAVIRPGVIRPLPVRPIEVPPPVEVPPAEKKEEKK